MNIKRDWASVVALPLSLSVDGEMRMSLRAAPARPAHGVLCIPLRDTPTGTREWSLSCDNASILSYVMGKDNTPERVQQICTTYT
ncbi:hypothetical protein KIPB_009089, partial [Kipferlia bialata]|eukprot:g9089.t1